MDTRQLGHDNPITIPVVGLGCNAFGRRIDEARSRSVIDGAIEAGVTFFDTAESYGNGLSEEYIGRAIKGRRDKVIIATKFGWGGLHAGKSHGTRENMRAALDQSLRKLQTDFVELYQLHKPDSACPVEETLHGLEELVQEGRVRFYGCSNFSADQMDEAVSIAKRDGLAGFVTAQNPWSVMDRCIEDGLVPVCEANGIGILPYYPLARGLLTGKYRRGEAAPEGARLGDNAASAAEFDILEKLETYAADHGHDLLTLGISWLASQPVTACVISGATRPEQVAANAAASVWVMTEDELAEIDRIVS